MAIKELKKTSVVRQIQPDKEEFEVEKFISKGGTVPTDSQKHSDDCRLTLRMPKWLMDKVDEKRKKRVGKISRNLWILETLDKTLR